MLKYSVCGTAEDPRFRLVAQTGRAQWEIWHPTGEFYRFVRQFCSIANLYFTEIAKLNKLIPCFWVCFLATVAMLENARSGRMTWGPWRSCLWWNTIVRYEQHYWYIISWCCELPAALKTLLWTSWMTYWLMGLQKEKNERNRLDTYCSTIYFASNSDVTIQIGSLDISERWDGISADVPEVGYSSLKSRDALIAKVLSNAHAMWKLHIYRSRHCVSILNFHLFLWSVVVKVCRIDKIRATTISCIRDVLWASFRKISWFFRVRNVTGRLRSHFRIF